MAAANKQTPSLADANTAEAISPSSLAGWGHFQQQVNVKLPAAIGRTNALISEARRLLSR